jgi:DNA-directed RNA polymerase beta subunit
MTPLNEKAKTDAPRRLHPSQYGFYCIFDTPEGPRTGLMHCLAINSRISVGVDPYTIQEILGTDLIKLEIPIFEKIGKPVFIDSRYIGICINSKLLKDRIGELRISKTISESVSILELDDAIEIWCDEGRVYRPVYKVRNKKVDDLSIDFLDANECDDEEIVVVPRIEEITDKSTHLEIDSTKSLLGFATSCIPFCNHNQSPRNVLGSLMIVQGIGVPFLNFKFHRGKLLILETPQKPLVTTKTRSTLTKITSSSYSDVEIPNVQTVILCIAPYSGLNQEDSFVMNKAFVERGGMRIMKRISYSASLTGTDEFGTPLEILGSKKRSYSKIDSDGAISPGTPVEFGDVLISKKSGQAIIYDESHSATVDSVEITLDAKGYQKFIVTVVQRRVPVIGDKFVISAHGQKGTIGSIVPDVDLPFSESTGMIPDIIMSPLAFPGRMTIALPIEHLLGKEYAMGLRREADGTAFQKVPDDLKFDLITEKMYDGITGEPIEAELAIGPISAMRLKHLSEEKLHGRSRGPLDLLTRQPKEGKGKGLGSAIGGAIRIGVLERDCIGVHGASAILLDRMFEQSDYFVGTYCSNCGLPSTERCEVCKVGHGVEIEIPYGSKLLFDELMGCGVGVRIKADFETGFKVSI